MQHRGGMPNKRTCIVGPLNYLLSLRCFSEATLSSKTVEIRPLTRVNLTKISSFITLTIHLPNDLWTSASCSIPVAAYSFAGIS